MEDIVYNYSIKNFGVQLCRKCQNWVKELDSTEETIRLYFALKERNIKPHIEKFDGYKTVDIAIPSAKINIEVDGQHHNYSYKQALADLKRTYYSFEKGYFTLRIPNSLLKEENKTFDEAINYIEKFIK
ncbi:DUF559 domain-containing protein [Dysgonomonas sp. Marseille-P4677]|uniref:DUF559 domain-containing protein n=1 Tax=Dysgonomonas sp. Marseille-P4677 TaxID=2364790 RepID=UPI0019123AD3|nr:DUF559 domain-containing protein [Dysgonomonas sp. Marseille-P4677]